MKRSLFRTETNGKRVLYRRKSRAKAGMPVSPLLIERESTAERLPEEQG